jgi:hypothetical protein
MDPSLLMGQSEDQAQYGYSERVPACGHRNIDWLDTAREFETSSKANFKF